MERTITFIAEHKKREYEQVKNQPAQEGDFPQDTNESELDPEPNKPDHLISPQLSHDI